MKPMRIAAGSLALAILVGSCAGGGDASEVSSAASAPGSSVVSSTTTPERDTTPSTTASSSTIETSPLAELVKSAGDLLFDDEATNSAAQPVWVDIDDIAVREAAVRDVGIEDDGEMEIPGATEIGWYRWSPSPGQDGSAVLAAHIAFDGVDGIFRNLDEVDVGALVTIGYDDGSVRDFEIVETDQYRKDELPFERIFAKEGDPVVALITCGGTFNQSLRSYDDNIVAYAVPR